MAQTFTPATATTMNVVYGVLDTIDDYIIQDLSVNEDVNTVQINDQLGQIAQVHPRQLHWTISFTAIGPEPDGEFPFTEGATAQFPSDTGPYYRVNTVEKRATYNDTQKLAITMEAWDGAYAYPDPNSTTGGQALRATT